MEHLTLVIPAKNEKESLPNVLSELKKYNLKIIVVLEKEDLDTINSIKEYDCKILHQVNKGYGDALTQGLRNVKTNFFCFFNADGSFNPNELKNMYNLAIKRNADFIFGSRYMSGALSQDDTIITFLGNKIFTFIGKFFFSLQISDILYTFVLGDTQKANNLQLKEKSFSFCVELPILAKKSKHKLISVPSHERARIAGKKKVNEFKDGFLILINMIKIYFKY
jgi:glycosyltransferase involved in cell wall biosynthesis|tara:strand:+ start:9 stop:677 length:669 start_codon:yes stop_codon:yes gene_type:complete